MASIQSLGLREPTALSYLVAESILPPDPSPSLYKWTTYQVRDEDGSDLVDEEILATEHCVVWSRAGAIQRAFNLDIESEPVLHALVTDFRSSFEKESARKEHEPRKDDTQRGLVVMLRTQAHIFLLSGDAHVLPLSFEVQHAFPCPYGFILQRHLEDREIHRSLEHHHDHDLSTISESLTTLAGASSRPSLASPGSLKTRPAPTASHAGRMPRTFSFTEVMSELGLVVGSAFRKGQKLDECKALPPTERLLYVSSSDELGRDKGTVEPVCISLTFDEVSSTFSVWHVRRDRTSRDPSQSGDKKHRTSTRTSMRKSSNMYSRDLGASTPAGRGAGTFRESFAGAAQPPADKLAYSAMEEQKSTAADDIASQLGPEFGDVGVQTRSARRVSSMLARTDLSVGADRNIFNDFALGRTGRKSLNRNTTRGESIGSVSERRSFGFRRRSSFPTNASVLSSGTSLLDVPGRTRIEGLHPLHHLELLDDGFSDGLDSDLPREIGFFRIKSFAPRNGAVDPLNVKVLTMVAPENTSAGQPSTRDIFLCIMDRTAQEMTIVSLLTKKFGVSPSRESLPGHKIELKATNIRHGSGIVDACKITDGPVERLVLLTQSRFGVGSLQLEAPWSASFRVDLPLNFAVFDPYGNIPFNSPSKDRDTGIKRTIPSRQIQLASLEQSGPRGQVVMVDQSQQHHTVQLRLEPRDPLVREILHVCEFVLSQGREENMLVAWWEISRWLRMRDPAAYSEWTALVVMLFSLAVPFISTQESKTASTHQRRKAGLLRPGSSMTGGPTSFVTLHYETGAAALQPWKTTPAWSWISHKQQPSSLSPTGAVTRHLRKAASATSETPAAEKKHFLVRCISWAREYMQTPGGESAIGPEGYLPTSVNNDRDKRCNAMGRILLGLHLLFEEWKLDTTSATRQNDSIASVVMVMAQLGTWLSWKDWTCGDQTYYGVEASDHRDWVLEDSVVDGLPMPAQPFEPPSIFQYIEVWISGGIPMTFPTLTTVADGGHPTTPGDALWQYVARLTPRTLAIVTCARRTHDVMSTQATIEDMLQSGIEDRILTTLPDGVAAAFHQAIAAQRGNRTNKWTPERWRLLARDDLEDTRLGRSVYHDGHRIHHIPTHEATRDYHSISNATLETETLQRWDASSEADRHTITRLIFSDDRRFQEASKLVNQTRTPVVEYTPEPEWTEADLLEAQKELAQYVTRRTLSVAAGRGMMHFNARVPLLTERVPIPAFSLQCVMKPRAAGEGTQAMTFSADKATFTEDKVCWAFFHNGASAGLMISKDAKGIDTSWILYNKPPELTNRHAGFLLALGLNGHLRSLAKWVAFKYLTPKHTMTSIGLLLGLSASYLGTMDTLITRLLSVHVTRLLPPGAAELNLSPLTQTTGIMGIGLLYYNSQHRRMSDVMISEVENNDAEEGRTQDAILRDEGYRLAAGFSLGLINLGQGKRLHSLHDMGVVERLLAIAVGTKNVNLVHVLDRATAGAVMGIAFIFLKTNDHVIAKKIDIPDTLHQFDYVRPDIFLLRTLAKHLIMWDSIEPTAEFVKHSLPPAYRWRSSLKGTKYLSTEDMPFFNIVAGICFSIGLRFSGSQREDVRDLLVGYLDQFLRLSRLPAINYDARVTLNSVRNCLDTVALATASVMAGSGDLIVMRRLRALHGRVDSETPFGSHLAAHMALGALFLGGGTCTFGTSDLAVAALCIAFYPVFPNDVLDNRGHLQALRHLWVLAVEARCLVARDGESGGAVVGGLQAQVNMRDGTVKRVKVPGLVPEFDTIQSVDVKGEGFWDAVVDFEDDPVRKRIQTEQGVNVYLKRRAAYDKSRRDLFVAELDALNECSGIPSINPNAVVTSKTGQGSGNPFEWLFELDALRSFDYAERALVTGSASFTPGRRLLKGTVVDTRLELEKGILPPDADDDGGTPTRGPTNMTRDKLWHLRLLFAWFDRWEKEDHKIEADHPDLSVEDKEEQKWWGSGGTWLRKEVIERLKSRVWRMAGGGEGDVTIAARQEEDEL